MLHTFSFKCQPTNYPLLQCCLCPQGLRSQLKRYSCKDSMNTCFYWITKAVLKVSYTFYSLFSMYENSKFSFCPHTISRRFQKNVVIVVTAAFITSRFLESHNFYIKLRSYENVLRNVSRCHAKLPLHLYFNCAWSIMNRHIALFETRALPL